PTKKVLEDELIQKGLGETHSTLCFPPHLPEPHSNGGRMPHGASRGIHNLFTSLWIDDSHPNDPPKEPLMRIGQFLSPQSLQFFVVEKGLHPEVVVHPQGLELLGQGEVCEDHIMDLNRNKLVFIKRRPNLLQYTCCSDG